MTQNKAAWKALTSTARPTFVRSRVRSSRHAISSHPQPSTSPCLRSASFAFRGVEYKCNASVVPGPRAEYTSVSRCVTADSEGRRAYMPRQRSSTDAKISTSWMRWLDLHTSSIRTRTGGLAELHGRACSPLSCHNATSARMWTKDGRDWERS